MYILNDLYNTRVQGYSKILYILFFFTFNTLIDYKIIHQLYVHSTVIAYSVLLFLNFDNVSILFDFILRLIAQVYYYPI